MRSVREFTQNQIHFPDLLHQLRSHGKQCGDALAEAGLEGYPNSSEGASKDCDIRPSAGGLAFPTRPQSPD